VRRWTASFIGQHLIRYGNAVPMDSSLRDAFWDVGNAARMSLLGAALAIPNAHQNWASWQYLGWTYEPSIRNTFYLGNGFELLGYPRHAAFIALRSAVGRKGNTFAPYEDVRNAADFAPHEWAYNAVTFGLRNLQERQARGEIPRGADADTARMAMLKVLPLVGAKITTKQQNTVGQMLDDITSKLPQ
jgi:hypothetical protein